MKQYINGRIMRLLCLMALIALQNSVFTTAALAQGDYGDVDIENPSDPTFGTKAKLTIKAEPGISAGYFNAPNAAEYGQEYTLSAYPRYGYEFVGWKQNGKIISTEASMVFTMPKEGDVQLTGVFRYNPENPGNPHPNNWDAETGEIILDDFQTGNIIGALNSTIAAYNIPTSSIKQITVAGRINEYDFRAFTNKGYANCELLDFSRTTGLDSIKAGAYMEDNTLKSIFLPSSLRYIDRETFFYCTNLDLVYCYATVPPELYIDNFYTPPFTGISKNAVLYVPLKSQNDYTKSDWATLFSDINAIPDDKVASIQINLPENNGGIYKNMSIEMVNSITGQTLKYIVTDRWQYTFNNLPRKTQWKAYLKNQAGYVLAQIKDITVPTYDYSAQHGWRVETYEFKDILPLRNVSLRVEAGNEDVTSKVNIVWSNTSDATLLSRNATAEGLIEGMNIKASVSIPQTLGMEYSEAEDTCYTVTSDEKQEIVYTLTPLEKQSISGTITNTEGEPLQNAVVTISQTLNGKYSKSFIAMTDAEGQYTNANTFKAPTVVTCSAKNYVTQDNTLDVLGEEPIDFCLSLIDGARIALVLNFKQIDDTTVTYPQPEKVSYTVKKGTKAVDFNLQQKDENGSYELVILEEITDGTSLTITASSPDKLFKDVKAIVKVNNKAATATLNITQLPSIKATFSATENSSVIGILYDSKGNFVEKKEYDMDTKSVHFDNLWDAAYTLVTMSYSDFYNSVLKLTRLTTLGLKAGTDYVKNTKTVSAGKVTTISISSVPVFDDTKLYYTDDTKTNLSLNKNEISVGNYLTVSAKVALKSDKKRYITNPRLIIDLPESVDEHEAYFVNGSLLMNQKIDYSDHTITGSQLVIDMNNHLNEDIKFCVIPSLSGEYTISAYLEFDYDGEPMTQPIGAVNYKSEQMSINVPSVSCTKVIPISGTAIGHSSIDIYCDGLLVAQTTSLANGVWSTTCTLPINDDNNVLEKSIYAVITTAQGVRIQTNTYNCLYNVEAIDVDVVHMYHDNYEIHKLFDLVFNFKNPSRDSQYYTYLIWTHDFSFTCDFITSANGVDANDPKNVKNVLIGVKTGTGYTDVPAYYSNGHWVAFGQFGDNYRQDCVPRNVRVSYDQYVGGKFYRHYVVYSGCRDVNFGIDPSGYIYEGVSSNRVEGATATIYYKEEVEDMYGIKTEKEVIWDATEYEQKNPLFTDAEGMYRWDVPDGLWQVRVEKDGYEETRSEWLPVPPPQLEVNLPIVQKSNPSVKEVHAYQTNEDNDFVDVTFDKYVKPETITTESVVLKNVDKEGEEETTLDDITFEWLNAEPVTSESEDSLVSKIRIYSHTDLSQCTEVRLILTSGIKSYAGISFQGYDQKLDIEKKIKELSVDPVVNIKEGGNVKPFLIYANPADASKGKTITVSTTSDLFATVSNDGKDFSKTTSLTLGEKGEATVFVKSGMLGSTTVRFNVEGVDMSAETIVKVLDASYFLKTEDPTFTTLNTELYSGQTVGLKCATAGATIYYTTDGTEPSAATSAVYDSKRPIRITTETTIKAMAVGVAGQSETISGTYTIKQGSTTLKLAEGWNWISHTLADDAALLNALKADSNVKRILNPTSELTNDATYGWVGNVTSMPAADGFKVYTDAATNVSAKSNEANAAQVIINLNEGWNWMGYPVNQSQSLEEALAEALSTEVFEKGDKIISLSGGYATYEISEEEGVQTGKWTGNITTLNPSDGYLFKAVSDKYFTFNNDKVSSAKSQALGGADLNIAPWNYDAHAYANVMGVTASLVDDADFGSDVCLGAFCGDECRGYAMEKNGVFYLSVHGNRGETITFRIFDYVSGITTEASEQMKFTSDIFGTSKDPVLLSFNGSTAISLRQTDIHTDAAVFDLYGRIIRTSGSNKPLTRGLYIQSGKKITVK